MRKTLGFIALLMEAHAVAAEPPMWDVHLHGTLDALGSEAATFRTTGGGLGLAVSKRLGIPLYFEGRVEGARVVDGAGRGGLLVGLRALPLPIDTRWAFPSLVVSAGGMLWAKGRAEEGPAVVGLPYLLGAAAVDIHITPSATLRLQAGWASTLRDPGGVHGTVGVVVRGPKPRAKDDEVVWRPFPACEWVNAAAAQEVIAAAQARPSESASEEEEEAVEPQPGEAVEPPDDADEPFGGAIIVVSPGDEVVFPSGFKVEADAQGTVAVEHTGGVLKFDVVGGGRTLSSEIPTFSGLASWTTVGAQGVQQHDVHFDKGSAEISDSVREPLQALARQTAGWSWRILGSYSLEGSQERNRVLASERAEAVRRVLLEILPASRLSVDVVPPDPDLPLDLQRQVRLVPVPAGSPVLEDAAGPEEAP